MKDDMDHAAAPPRKKSQKRQRNHQVKTNLLDDEFNEVAARARAVGLTMGGFARASMLGDAGIRAQRRLPVDAQLLREALAQLGKYGNNMNQIAHQLNAQGEDALAADFRRALEEWAEIRNTMYEAMGRDPSGTAPPGHTPA